MSLVSYLLLKGSILSMFRRCSYQYWVVLSLITLVSGCEWESQLYKKYVNEGGEIATCVGECQNQFDKATCERAAGEWTAESCMRNGVESVEGEEACLEGGGTWNSGKCKVGSQDKCVQEGGTWVRYEYSTLDLGNGYYVRKVGEQVRCGTFDEIFADSTGECLNQNYIEALNDTLKYRICPVSAHVCVGMDGDDPNASVKEGMCTSCPAGQARCVESGSSECFDLRTSEAHCGACGTRCESGQSCHEGKCVNTTCSYPNLACGVHADDGVTPICYDANKYCGAVCEGETLTYDGIDCAALNASCSKDDNSGYTCKCLPGFYPEYEMVEDEGGENRKLLRCIDPKTDANYCGSLEEDIASGTKRYCMDNEHCEGGSCVCNLNYIRCNGSCVHPETSSLYCGAKGTCSDDDVESSNYRGKICPQGTVCRNNDCICDTDNGYVKCQIGGEYICVHPADPLFCGASGDSCGENSYENCQNSNKICQLNGYENIYQCVCPEGLVLCGEKCIDPNTDSEFCGVDENCEGGMACGAGEVCLNKTCTANCPGEQEVCGNQCVSLKTDANHCGKCDEKCNVNNMLGLCVEGTCHFAACMAGYGNCVEDGDDESTLGCETDLTLDVNHCGLCDNACDFENANSVCQEGKCQVTSCVAGYLNCDGNMSTGCEQNITNDVNNCGECGKKCSLENATSVCTNGTCTIGACEDKYKDCNNKASDGCESDIRSSVSHCGGCGKKCNLSCFPEKKCKNKCVSSKCCVTGQLNKKYKKEEIRCCSGYNLYKYTYKKGSCKNDTHYGCYKPDEGKGLNSCWKKV